MIPRNAPVFRSTQQALHVAFLMGILPVTQKSNTQMLLERLMEEAGVAKVVQRDGTLNFAGLSPMEVRGQCAMVRGAVEHHCLPYERAAIVAWFSSADDTGGKGASDVAAHRQKVYAITALHGLTQPRMTIDSVDVQRMIVWHVHARGRLRDRLTERAIAAESSVSQSTVHRNVVVVSQTCSALRRRGMDRLEEMFRRDGLVDVEAAAADA
jgi:hypothetical protein